MIWIYHDICLRSEIRQNWPKKWTNWSEKLVGPHVKIVFGLRNFGHGLSSSYYLIYVLRSKIWPNLTKKVKKLIRKMSGARWKNGPMTPKLWPWPILIILHNICVAIQDLTKNVKNWSEKWVGLDEKMVLRLWNFGHSLSSSYYTIYVLQSKIWPNLTKKVKKIWEKWVGLDEKMVLWLRNFGHGLSSSCYTIYVLQ